MFHLQCQGSNFLAEILVNLKIVFLAVLGTVATNFATGASQQFVGGGATMCAIRHGVPK
jgi:hypothetical protein